MERLSATIEDAKVCKISKLFRRKPPGLTFADTDAVIVTAKTPDGRTASTTFYVRLKSDGTFSTSALRVGGRAKQLRFAKFLRHYKLAKDVERCNVREGAADWKGKKVDVVPYKRGGYIYVP